MHSDPLPVLYSSIRSPHCLKVSMVLHEKGVPFDRVEIDLPGRQQKSPAYLAINPLGLVPAYRDDRGIHLDSLAIMCYLDQRYPWPRLFPQEGERLRQVLHWIELSSGPFREVSHELYWQLLEPPAEGPDQAEVERLSGMGRALLRDLETALANGGGWLVGEFSAADISVFAWVQGYRRFGGHLLGKGGTGFGGVREWLEEIASRSSFLASESVRGRPFEEAAFPLATRNDGSG